MGEISMPRKHLNLCGEKTQLRQQQAKQYWGFGIILIIMIRFSVHEQQNSCVVVTRDCRSSTSKCLQVNTPFYHQTIYKYSQPPLNRTHPFDPKISGSAGNRINETCIYSHVQCTCSISKCVVFLRASTRRKHMTEASARRKKKVMIYTLGTCMYMHISLSCT